jgi:predicted Zn-dependent peptidase
MAPIVTTLSNGLRIASHDMPHLETVSLGVWVAAGARHEADHEHGLSHLLEHMAFKGTASRSARKIAEEIEEVGGDLNAATGLDMTAYFARVLKGDEGVALELLSDILLNSAFDEEELDKEREVILQEIAGIEDSPEELAYDLLQTTAFPDQALGRSIIGTPTSVKSIQASDIKAFLEARYHPGAMVVSAAGAIGHDRLVRHVQALFGGLTPRFGGEEQPARYGGGIAASEKPFEQSHLLIGFPAPGFREPDFFTAQVFSGLFGGGMSSRLFQEIRERRGLCYAIYSSIWGLKDAGMLAVHAATGPEMVEELANLVAGELADVARRGPSPSEMQRAKAQLRAGLLMALESSSVSAEQMARHLLAHDRLISPQELSDSVAEVTASQIQAFAGQLKVSTPSVILVGSGKRSRAQAEQAAEAVTQMAVEG